VSAIELVIEARRRDLGGFEVGRVLPAAARRMVGPFVFFDHMGPADLAPGSGLDVRPHPHIHLATVTYLFTGEILHRDSLGSAQVIRPGAINWMSAGSGIVHSERSTDDARAKGAKVHGLQLWAALPTAMEDTPPTFVHHPEATLPAVSERGVSARVLAGGAYGRRSPVSTASELFYVEVRLDAGARIEVPREHEERALYLVDGDVAIGGAAVLPRTMAVLGAGDAVLEARTASHVVMLGGARLDGPRYVWWNFVSSSKERIVEAARAWRARELPLVPGDEKEFIPLTDDPHFAP
jgi:redox-sensitive bicupin YhaK (pirin superfamily)